MQFYEKSWRTRILRRLRSYQNDSIISFPQKVYYQHLKTQKALKIPSNSSMVFQNKLSNDELMWLDYVSFAKEHIFNVI